MAVDQKPYRPIRAALIGCGKMTRHHLQKILPQFANTCFPVVCEPSASAYEQLVELFEQSGLKAPPNEPELGALLEGHAQELDAAFIVTPHYLHHAQARACLKAGLDVLLEKPMVMSAAEAESLTETRDRTGRLLVVAFNGSLSPQIRAAARMLSTGELGRISTISAMVWENWRQHTSGTWRQVPAQAGGGFLFDTGAHMLNSVVDLAGEEFTEVAALLDNRGTEVDVTGVVIGRLASGALATLHASGETIPSCAAEIRVFCEKGILRTDIWGHWLEIQREGDDAFQPVEVPFSAGAWEQFMAVREGRIPNPCPPEIGLRMARLWDAIRQSAALGGKLVPCGPAVSQTGSESIKTRAVS